MSLDTHPALEIIDMVHSIRADVFCLAGAASEGVHEELVPDAEKVTLWLSHIHAALQSIEIDAQRILDAATKQAANADG